MIRLYIQTQFLASFGKSEELATWGYTFPPGGSCQKLRWVEWAF